jgi:hypothetical protein
MFSGSATSLCVLSECEGNLPLKRSNTEPGLKRTTNIEPGLKIITTQPGLKVPIQNEALHLYSIAAISRSFYTP